MLNVNWRTGKTALGSNDAFFLELVLVTGPGHNGDGIDEVLEGYGELFGSGVLADPKHRRELKVDIWELPVGAEYLTKVYLRLGKVDFMAHGLSAGCLWCQALIAESTTRGH